MGTIHHLFTIWGFCNWHESSLYRLTGLQRLLVLPVWSVLVRVVFWQASCNFKVSQPILSSYYHDEESNRRVSLRFQEARSSLSLYLVCQDGNCQGHENLMAFIRFLILKGSIFQRDRLYFYSPEFADVTRSLKLLSGAYVISLNFKMFYTEHPNHPANDNVPMWIYPSRLLLKWPNRNLFCLSLKGEVLVDWIICV